jgi:hypothetical protein
VICLGFDDFVEYNKRVFNSSQEKAGKGKSSIVAMDSDEMRKQFVGLWSLIPLTRAIDSLVITLSDPDGDIAGY